MSTTTGNKRSKKSAVALESAEHYTPEQMIDAIRRAHGIAQGAAELLGCDRMQVFRYMKRYHEVDEVYKEEREKNVDFAENKQLQAMRNGERWAIENWLFCSKEGRDRGWIKRAEQAQDLGLLNAIQIVIPDNARGDVTGFGPDGQQQDRERTIDEIDAELAHQRQISNLVDGRMGRPRGESML